jgi:hypothetical protein
MEYLSAQRKLSRGPTPDKRQGAPHCYTCCIVPAAILLPEHAADAAAEPCMITRPDCPVEFACLPAVKESRDLVAWAPIANISRHATARGSARNCMVLLALYYERRVGAWVRWRGANRTGCAGKYS